MHVHGADLGFEVNQSAITLHHVVDIIDISHGLRWDRVLLAFLSTRSTGLFKLEKLLFKFFKFDFLLG